jgi:hypothetical protein
MLTQWGLGKLDELILLTFREFDESLDTNNSNKQLLMPVLSYEAILVPTAYLFSC